MSSVSFPFKEEKSAIFGKIYRPISQVSFKHLNANVWRELTMLIDTGADYTILPKFLAEILGINLKKNCRVITTEGAGGKQSVFLFKGKISTRIGGFKRSIPVGFLDNNYIPPLLGRQEFFETFRVVFDKFQVTFSESK